MHAACGNAALPFRADVCGASENVTLPEFFKRLAFRVSGKVTNMSAETQAAKPANPFFEAPSSKKTITLVGIYIAVIGSIVASSTFSTLLPVAAVEVGGMDYYSLANTLMGVLSVAVMPLWGYLGAKNPAIRVPLFTVSLLLGTLSVLLRAFAPTMMFIVITSIPYGVVSAGIYVLGYAVIRDMYDRAKAGTYLGLSGTMMSIGMLAGPVAGGIIMDVASWRWVCHVIWPMLAVGGIVVMFGVRPSKEEVAHMARSSGKFDMSGAVAMLVFLAALILAISLGSTFLPFGSFESNAVFAVAAVAFVVLVLVIRKKQERAFIPAPVLKNRNVLLFFVSNFFTMFSNMALFFFLPMYVIAGMGLSATEAGLSTTMYSVIGVFLSPVFGRMIGKSGNAKNVLSLGCIVRIVGALFFLFFLAPDTNVFLVYVAMFLIGLARPIQSSGYSAGPMIQVPEKLRMQGNSIIQVGQNLGGSVGTAIYGVVLGIFGVIEGMPIALIISAVTAALALVCVLMLKKLEKED